MTGIQRDIPGRFLRRARPSLTLFFATLLVLSGLGMVASPASAAPSDSAQARTLFREARRLMDKGRFAQACPKLQESLRIDPGMGTQFNLAHCWEQLGLTASAWGVFLDVAAAAESSGQRKRERAARPRAAALEPKLSRLRIDVPSAVPGMTVLRAGEELGRGAWGEAMPVDPGTYHIEASAPEKLGWSGDVVVEKAGETVSIEVPPLEDIAPPVVEAPPPEPEPVRAVTVEDRRGGGAGRTVATLLLGAVAVGGAVTGTIYGIEARNETKAAQKLCTGGPNGTVCDRDDGIAERDELRLHRNIARRAALISYVSIGVGAAGLIGATLLLVTGGGDDEESATAELVPVLGPDLAGINWTGHF
jgi:hypothetical protein